MLKGWAGPSLQLQHCNRCTHARAQATLRRYTVQVTPDNKAAHPPLPDVAESSARTITSSAMGNERGAGSRPNVWRCNHRPNGNVYFLGKPFQLTTRTDCQDYLIKLKARCYPSVERTLLATGENYLVPSSLGDEPGRSWYLTLHPDFTFRLNGPGPHLGILHQNNLSIPRKLDEWIRFQLAEKIIKEFQSLARRLRLNTPRMKNMSAIAHDDGMMGIMDIVSKTAEGGQNNDQLHIRLPLASSTELDTLSVPVKAGLGVIDLSAFPIHLRSSLLQAVEDIRLIERKHTLRHAILAKANLSASHLRHLIGRPQASGQPEKDQLLVLSSATSRGQLCIPAMTALLRWKLYSGQGWEHADQPSES